MYDIVYFIKEGRENEELRYSLRSLKNFPHGKVWIYGGCPKGIKPDQYIYVEQSEHNKWQNVNKMLRLACSNPKISKKFWLFNDDFFVMQKVENPTNHYNGDLYKRIVLLEDKYGEITEYSKLLRGCCKELEALGATTLNYTLHVPMLFDRKKAIELFNLTDFPGFRSLYANYFKIGGTPMKDNKITSLTRKYKDGIYLSTHEHSFKDGEVGKQIRELFPDKCKYERS